MLDNMRVGGLASGMDIEAMVDKLMQAERIPLDKLNQNQTKLTWKRDSFREMNRSLLDLSNLTRDMKRTTVYNSKTVTSSQENAVTATGSGSAQNGLYQINVSQIATNALNMGTEKAEDIEEEHVGKEISFSIYNEKGEKEDFSYEIEEGESVQSLLKRITKDDNGVRAFQDASSGKVIMETNRTGVYNVDENGDRAGNEIIFNNDEGGNSSFFTDVLKLDSSNEVQAQNAIFSYNNSQEIETKNNEYNLNGMTFQFHNETEGNARMTVINNVEDTFESITAFVEKYNEVIDKMNKSQQEEIHRDFPPLTEEQKKEMSEKEIEQWEEKAQSGILRNESSIRNGMYSMRSSWYANVETGGEFSSLTQIGITTSSKHSDGGKLVIDETKLRQALNEDPESVQGLFTNSSENESKGIMQRLEDSVKSTIKKIEQQAGKDYHTLDNYSIGKQMKSNEDRISTFQSRLEKVETRYWNQFTQMEKAIQRLNDQSEQLLSQFGQ